MSDRTYLNTLDYQLVINFLPFLEKAKKGYTEHGSYTYNSVRVLGSNGL